MRLTSKRVQQLVEIAYVLEPILDKDDCTTRYKDLPNKPLTDFIIAGINVSRIMGEYADSVLNHGNKRMFSHYKKAVKVSNEFKNKKVINLGLIEHMFVFIYLRLRHNSINSLFRNITKDLKNTTNKDVVDNLTGFGSAISTSTNKFKKTAHKDNFSFFSTAKNVYEEFNMVFEKFPVDTAGYIVAKQYTTNFPIVKKYIDEIDETKGFLKSIETSFNKMHKEDPSFKIGYLADLSAIAMFVYLSFQNPSYIIK